MLCSYLLMVKLKTQEDLKHLRISGRILGRVLKMLSSEAREGTLLSALNEKAHKYIKAEGASPAFLHYRAEGASAAYPASICTSINDEIVHGLPRNYALKKGDVLKLDLGVDYKGLITDAATTVVIGKTSRKVMSLLKATEEALYDALSVCKAGNHLGDIGYTIERRILRGGFKIIQGLTGHGTGYKLHEDPTVWNFGKKGEGIELKEGLVLAIEPMASIGSKTAVERDDGTFVTKDGSIAAHFEHTVYITKHGCEVLTK